MCETAPVKTIFYLRTLSFALALCGGAIAADGAPERKQAAAERGYRVIDWKDLVPADYRPEQVIQKYMRRGEKLKDFDPEAQELFEQLRRELEMAPVVESLNNTMVKLSGFLVALDAQGQGVSEFLLVPYYGACIHVPPPPSNQIVLVRTGAKPYRFKQLFETVQVTGRLKTEFRQHKLAWANYVIDATNVEHVSK